MMTTNSFLKIGFATKLVRSGWGTRRFAGKTPNRAAVHGVNQQPTHGLDDREKIEEDIRKTNQEQEKERKKVEEKVDSQLNNSKNVVSESPESLSSS